MLSEVKKNQIKTENVLPSDESDDDVRATDGAQLPLPTGDGDQEDLDSGRGKSLSTEGTDTLRSGARSLVSIVLVQDLVKERTG